MKFNYILLLFLLPLLFTGCIQQESQSSETSSAQKLFGSQAPIANEESESKISILSTAPYKDSICDKAYELFTTEQFVEYFSLEESVPTQFSLDYHPSDFSIAPPTRGLQVTLSMENNEEVNRGRLIFFDKQEFRSEHYFETDLTQCYSQNGYYEINQKYLHVFSAQNACPHFEEFSIGSMTDASSFKHGELKLSPCTFEECKSSFDQQLSTFSTYKGSVNQLNQDLQDLNKEDPQFYPEKDVYELLCPQQII